MIPRRAAVDAAGKNKDGTFESSKTTNECFKDSTLPRFLLSFSAVFPDRHPPDRGKTAAFF
jgi:hypothetical protein